jgi:hypothetical protein
MQQALLPAPKSRPSNFMDGVGDATGLTPVHINRTIEQLERDGLIRRSSARSIQIGDWRKLAEVGDFDST